MYELYARLPMPLPPSQMEELPGTPDEADEEIEESRVIVINLIDDDDTILF